VFGNGDKYWMKDGVIHRENDKPAVMTDKGEYWFDNGMLYKKNVR